MTRSDRIRRLIIERYENRNGVFTIQSIMDDYIISRPTATKILKEIPTTNILHINIKQGSNVKIYSIT